MSPRAEAAALVVFASLLFSGCGARGHVRDLLLGPGETRDVHRAAQDLCEECDQLVPCTSDGRYVDHYKPDGTHCDDGSGAPHCGD